MDGIQQEIPPGEQTPEHSNLNDNNVNFLEEALGFVTTYGWFLAVGVAVCIYIWKTKFEYFWRRWTHQLTENREVRQYYENPEKHLAMHDAMAETRRRMQEQNDRLSMQHEVKLKEKEEQKRLDKINELEKREVGHGTRLCSRVDEHNSPVPLLGSKKKSKNNERLREDFNPLMGSSSGTTYRPNRRNCSSGG